MHIEILTIGDELLRGAVRDLNADTVGNALWSIGLDVAGRTTLPDRIDELVRAFRAIAERADICITTGGLGPTPDDLTIEALSNAARAELVFNDDAWARIVHRFGDRCVPPTNRKQAMVPRGARVLQTEVGTAPGVELRIGRCRFFSLPGVPHEMRWHLDEHVLPAIVPGASRRTSRRLHFVGIGESSLAQLVGDVVLPQGVDIAYRTRDAINELQLRGRDAAAVDAARNAIINAAGPTFAGEGPHGLIATVINLCRDRRINLGAAESCTGGLIGAEVTSVPGASDVFVGSIVSYSNTVKQSVLGVRAELLEAHGVVSESCARAMAEGARAALGCDLAVAVTGVAGPGGGTPNKPVGTVCFGWSGAGLDAVETRHMAGDRDSVRRHTVVFALDRIRRGLS